jgi:hypothetical protein
MQRETSTQRTGETSQQTIACMAQHLYHAPETHAIEITYLPIQAPQLNFPSADRTFWVGKGKAMFGQWIWVRCFGA